jgi:hypothetical protein
VPVPKKQLEDMCGEDANPYDTLNLNFEKQIIQKEINLY